MGFSFTATAECDHCGQLLGSSDENCDHNGRTVEKHLFRRLGEGRDSLTGVQTTAPYKWYSLAEDIGEDWIAYQYLGTKQHVNALLESKACDSIEEMSYISMSTKAPPDVNEDVFEQE